MTGASALNQRAFLRGRRPSSINLRIEEVGYSSCVGRVEKSLETVPGALDAAEASWATVFSSSGPKPRCPLFVDATERFGGTHRQRQVLQ